MGLLGRILRGVRSGPLKISQRLRFGWEFDWVCYLSFWASLAVDNLLAGLLARAVTEMRDALLRALLGRLLMHVM